MEGHMKFPKSILYTYISIFTIILAMTSASSARNSTMMVSIDQVTNSDEYRSRIDPSVTLLFHPKKPPAATVTYGETSVVGKARGDTDYLACKNAFIEALTDLQNIAKKNGADTIFDIHSFFKRRDNFSATQFECHSGSFSSVVGLKGTLLSTDKK